MSGGQTRQDDDLDKGLEDTFPASDPPATGGITGPDEKPPENTVEEK